MTAPSNWKKSIVINAVGAVATFIVLCVFIATKFLHGAWIVVVVIPVLVLLFRAIHKHYVMVAKQLSTEGLGAVATNKTYRDRSDLRNTPWRCLLRCNMRDRLLLTGCKLCTWISRKKRRLSLKDKWERWGAGVQLVVLPSPYRELTRPLVRHINRLAKENANDIITVVLPEFIPAKWWQHILHNQSSLLLKGSLLFKRGRDCYQRALSSRALNEVLC